MARYSLRHVGLNQVSRAVFNEVQSEQVFDYGIITLDQ